MKTHKTVTITKRMVVANTPSPCSGGLARFRPVTISTDPEAACNIQLALTMAENAREYHYTEEAARLRDLEWGLETWMGRVQDVACRPEAMHWFGEDPMQLQQGLAALADHVLTARGC